MELVEGGTNRGKDMLLLNGFKFRKCHTGKNGITRWRCTVKSCAAKILTEGNEDIIVQQHTDHDHNANQHSVERQLIRQPCKRKALDDLTEKPAKIIRKEIGNSTELSTLIFQDTVLLREAVYRARRSVVPVLPKTRLEVHKALENVVIRTNQNELFLLVNDETAGVLVFSCESNLRFLCLLQTIYVDGTFSYCTKFFTQLFTIHGLRNGHYIPLVYCVLPSKTEINYRTTFLFIKEKCLDLGLQFNPTTLVADFEIAIHTAARAVWPQVVITGCRFHLAQAWWRKIQKLGLSTQYKDPKSEIGKWLTYVFGLPFLNPNEVGDSFAFDFSAEQPNDPKVQAFSDYLVDNYIGEEATFPPEMWAEATSSTLNTTNACESFHSRFNASFYSPHPSLFLFYQALLQFQVDTYLKIRGSDLPAVIRKRTTLRKRHLLEENIVKYQNGQLSRFDFVKKVSPHFRGKKITG